MSNINETLKFKGTFMATLFKADGEIVSFRKDNLILNVGFDFIADSIGKSASRPNVMSYIVVGTNNTAVLASQTGMSTELARKAATYAHTAGTQTFTFATTFNAGEATGAIVEAGVANASSAGTFLDRVVFPVINKGADDTLTCTFQFTLS